MLIYKDFNLILNVSNLLKNVKIVFSLLDKINKSVGEE